MSRTLVSTTLDGTIMPSPRPATRAGLVWVCENCLIYSDDFRDFLTMASSERRRKKMGLLLGVIIGETPDLPQLSWINTRIIYEWIRDDPKIEARKRLKRFLRKHPKVRQDLTRKRKVMFKSHKGRRDGKWVSVLQPLASFKEKRE